MNIFNFKNLLKRIEEEKPSLKDLLEVLKIEDKKYLAILFVHADKVRKKYCSDGILLRGLIEFSNFCVKDCFYCGLNKNNSSLKRYRLSKEEILQAVEKVAKNNIKTVVLQSGDDLGIKAEWLSEVILEIKKRFDLAITLSCGERSFSDYKLWRQAGADRYLLKIETSEKKLYEAMHTQASFAKRIKCLKDLKRLGYQVGSGNMVGLPGQTLKSLAQDILFFKENGFDMLGISPFIPHPNSRFAKEKKGSFLLTLKVLALTRIVTKNSHIPATTALGSFKKDYRLDGLKCGANVLMPNFTPQPYRKLYEIYPNKKCLLEPQGSCLFCVERMAKYLGRFIDYGRGDSLKLRVRLLRRRGYVETQSFSQPSGLLRQGNLKEQPSSQ